jgi:hypothetical protein
MKNSTRTPVFRTLSFTRAEHSRIQKAAKICGFRPGDANFARNLVLGGVAGILRSGSENEPDPTEVRRGLEMKQRLIALAASQPTTQPSLCAGGRGAFRRETRG